MELRKTYLCEVDGKSFTNESDCLKYEKCLQFKQSNQLTLLYINVILDLVLNAND